MAPEQNKNKEYQTVRLFATLGILTFLAVFLFKVVLFGPGQVDKNRTPAELSSVHGVIMTNTAEPVLLSPEAKK